MKIWKRFLALGLVTIITAMMFVGCGSSDISEGVAKNDYPITINGVTLNSQPTGVAVLSQNIADVILTGGFEATLKQKAKIVRKKIYRYFLILPLMMSRR